MPCPPLVLWNTWLRRRKKNTDKDAVPVGNLDFETKPSCASVSFDFTRILGNAWTGWQLTVSIGWVYSLPNMFTICTITRVPLLPKHVRPAKAHIITCLDSNKHIHRIYNLCFQGLWLSNTSVRVLALVLFSYTWTSSGDFDISKKTSLQAKKNHIDVRLCNIISHCVDCII